MPFVPAPLLRIAGGRSQLRIALTLAAVLGLNGADSASISASAVNLEHAFHVGNAQIGLLLSVVAIFAAVLTVPAGILADRTKRTRLLTISILCWSAAMLLSGAAPSYGWLIASRAVLGIVSATAGPTVASLTGDYFPAEDRARIFGLIVSGELAGTGLGFALAGEIAALASWRYAIWWLAVPGLFVAWAVHRLREPARRGQVKEPAPKAKPGTPDLAAQAVRRARVEPDQALVLHADPTNRSIWWTVRYVLRVRTNLIIIVASALGYFYLAGLRAFSIIYATSHYGVSKQVADVLLLVTGFGAVAGVFAGGRVADRLLRQGKVNARIIVPAVCLLALVPVLAIAIVMPTAVIAVPLLTAGAFLLGAPNPPLDAARLDIMHPSLWGRAEGIRTVFRTLAEAGAPALFGYVSQYAFGSMAASSGAAGSSAAHGSGTGLEYTFLVFLLPLAAAGLLALLALRTYPRDVATARASEAATAQSGRRSAPRERAGKQSRTD